MYVIYNVNVVIHFYQNNKKIHKKTYKKFIKLIKNPNLHHTNIDTQISLNKTYKKGYQC